jgi:hypothetical protein
MVIIYRWFLFVRDRQADSSGRPISTLSIWRSTYQGHGMGKHGTTLFCSCLCGLQFAVACWTANMRIRRDQ